MILNLKRQDHLLLDIDMLAVLDLIKFLKPFEEATKALEGDLWPTLQKVYHCFSKVDIILESLSMATRTITSAIGSVGVISILLQDNLI